MKSMKIFKNRLKREHPKANNHLRKDGNKMEEVKNVVSVTLTREDFQNLFNPLLDSIMSKKSFQKQQNLL